MTREHSSSDGDASAIRKLNTGDVRRLLVALRLDKLPSLFTFVDLLGGEKTGPSATKVHPSLEGKTASLETDNAAVIELKNRPLEVHGVRMLELTERLSSVMKTSEVGDWSARDPVLNAFHTFGQLHNVAVSGDVQLVPDGAFADVLSEHVTSHRSDMILLPWSESGNAAEINNLGFTEPTQSPFGHQSYNHIISNVMAASPCSAAIFINNGFGAVAQDNKHLKSMPSMRSLREATEHPTAPLQDRSHHIFLPFFGGLDDHVALNFVLRLAQNPNVTATITHIIGEEDYADPSTEPKSSVEATASPKAETTVTTRKSQETSTEQDCAFFIAVRDSITVETMVTHPVRRR